MAHTQTCLDVYLPALKKFQVTIHCLQGQSWKLDTRSSFATGAGIL